MTTSPPSSLVGWQDIATAPKARDNVSPVTLDTIRAAMDAMKDIPPPALLASWEHFPREHAMTFKWDGRDYVGAHPDFWAKLPPAQRGQIQSLFALEICDFSRPYFRPRKEEFFKALASVMSAERVL